MSLSAYELALLAGGFTILGALIASVCTFRFALHLQRRQARLEAGRRLREAFSGELAAVASPNTDPGIVVEHMLQQAFPKHLAAVNEFKFHLSGQERLDFDEAWHSYWHVGGSVRFFDYYMGENAKGVFEERVGNILRFTET